MIKQVIDMCWYDGEDVDSINDLPYTDGSDSIKAIHFNL